MASVNFTLDDAMMFPQVNATTRPLYPGKDLATFE
jgi:hypothetical protein